MSDSAAASPGSAAQRRAGVHWRGLHGYCSDSGCSLSGRSDSCCSLSCCSLSCCSSSGCRGCSRARCGSAPDEAPGSTGAGSRNLHWRVRHRLTSPARAQEVAGREQQRLRRCCSSCGRRGRGSARFARPASAAGAPRPRRLGRASRPALGGPGARCFLACGRSASARAAPGARPSRLPRGRRAASQNSAARRLAVRGAP